MNIRDTTVLITGATDGLGKLIVTRLAAGGARVLLHGRSEEKGRAALRDVERATGNSRLEYCRADLASLDEVRRLARQVSDVQGGIDVLINNAGIGFGAPGAQRDTSRDGHELRFAVNYLAPFLLTHLLLPTLRSRAPSRIVNVASIGQAPIDFGDVMLTRSYDGRRAYGRSKLALIMFTLDLTTMLENSGVTTNAVHPATLMNTNMVAEAAMRPQATVEEGAEAVLHLATSPEVARTSGRFFDGKRESRAHPAAYDSNSRIRLRELSVSLVGLNAAELLASANLT